MEDSLDIPLLVVAPVLALLAFAAIGEYLYMAYVVTR